MRPNDPELQHLLRDAVWRSVAKELGKSLVKQNHRRNSLCHTSNSNKTQQFDTWKWTKNFRNGFEKGQRLLVGFLTKLAWVELFSISLVCMDLLCLMSSELALHFLNWFWLPSPPRFFLSFETESCNTKSRADLKTATTNCLFERLNYHKCGNKRD